MLDSIYFSGENTIKTHGENSQAVDVQFLTEVFSIHCDVSNVIASYSKLLEPQSLGYASLYFSHRQGAATESLIQKLNIALQQCSASSLFHMLSVHNILILILPVHSGVEIDQLQRHFKQFCITVDEPIQLTVTHYPNLQHLLSILIPDLKMCDYVEPISPASQRKALYNSHCQTQALPDADAAYWSELLTLSSQNQEWATGKIFSSIYTTETAQIMATRFLYQLMHHL